ncbi:MAG TPA: GMC family oxidoreductase [Cyclobacteriaceae bacterium]|nr:GMC family oxidoreductase [Cyclobacteriaceae bacterium]
MIIDARQIQKGTVLRGDVCVVGAGAAGITLAFELAKGGLNVILLEAGGRKWNPENQDLYKGTVLRPDLHAPLDRYRHRLLGGTTAVWGGRCIPFDNIDFEFREFIPHSTWPISRKDLEEFYRIAQQYCHCGNFTYLVKEAVPSAPVNMIPGFSDGDVVTSVLERFSLPTHFGKAYFKELCAAPNIQVVLNASCLNIKVSKDGRRVSSLQMSSLSKKDFEVKGNAAVLAAGGLEVTRLLLASNQRYKDGIGNHSGWLGRCYMSHISGNICDVKLSCDPDRVIFGYEVDPDGVYCRRRFWISEEAQRKNRTLNFVAMLDNPPMYNPEHRDGVLSMAFFAKNIQAIRRRIPPEFSKQLAMGTTSKRVYAQHLRNVLADIPHICYAMPQFAYKRFMKARMMPSLVMKSRTNTYSLHYHTEQAPNFESRVTLSDDRDTLGMPRLLVDFRILDLDIESIYLSHQLIDQQLRKYGCGKIVFNKQDVLGHIREQVGVGGHHIGTTRMSKEESKGVVNENCRVHGLRNLFVASSSVFPTSSQANPTLTIVAIAARIAAHLKENLQTL